MSYYPPVHLAVAVDTVLTQKQVDELQIVTADTTAADVAITLPANPRNDSVITITNIAGLNVGNVTTTDGSTINGAASPFALAAAVGKRFCFSQRSDELVGNWFIIGTV